MILALLLAVSSPQSVVDAENDFARRAQIEGQWTAFRATAAPDAIIFVPRPTNAHEFLKGLPDPELTYQWWPAQAFVSCDGGTAVTTGPAVRGHYRGYFTTIWRRQVDGGWKWILDHGAALTRPRPASDRPVVSRAVCLGIDPVLVPIQIDPAKAGRGQSADSRLTWNWRFNQDGSRKLSVGLWKGSTWESVLVDDVPAPVP